MAHYVVCPQKKKISRIFKISGALIVKKLQAFVCIANRPNEAETDRI
jgi:hypothetical protein